MNIRSMWWILCFMINFLIEYSCAGLGNILDISYWTCLLKKRYSCPDNDIKFYLYTPETGSFRNRIDLRNPLALRYSPWEPQRKNVLIIHGFNSTESKSPMTTLRNAYLSRGDYNIFMIDWFSLARFPCYLSSLSNTRLVSLCSAQLYAYLMNLGGSAEQTTCVGHSLGAHICGMMSSHLSVKQHKIIGLDPARPLVSSFGSPVFRLTPDDAHQVQVIHTNSGFLGESGQVGHVDFCVNGGRLQPGCKGHKLRKARCSHFQSACYFASTVIRGDSMIGQPCVASCPKTGTSWGLLPGMPVPMGHDTPFTKASESNNPMWNLHNSQNNYFRLHMDKTCSKTRLSFHWILREKTTKKRVMDFPNFKQMSVLAIKSNVLGFGKFILEVTATDLGSGSKKTLECWINSVTGTPFPILLGGHLRTAHKGETIYLDASQSEESGVKNVQYTWDCTTSTGQYQGCQKLKNIRGKITSLKIEANPEVTYAITLTLSAKDFAKSEKQEIKVVDDSAPRLEIKCEKNCPAKGTFEVYLYMKLFLRAVCLRNCEGVKYEWNVDPPVEGLKLQNSPKLILVPQTFKMSLQYKFSVTVSKNNLAIGSAMMMLKTCANPTQNGTCTVEPSQGISLKTLFKITCASFVYHRPISRIVYQNDVILTEDVGFEFNVRLAAPNEGIYIDFRDDLMIQSTYFLSTPIKLLFLLGRLGTWGLLLLVFIDHAINDNVKAAVSKYPILQISKAGKAALTSNFVGHVRIFRKYAFANKLVVNSLFSGMNTEAVIKEVLAIYNGDSEYADSVKYLAQTGRIEEAVQVIHCLLKELQALTLDGDVKKFIREFFVRIIKDILEFPTNIMPYGLMSLLPQFKNFQPKLDFAVPFIKMCYKLGGIVIDQTTKEKNPLLHWQKTQLYASLIVKSVSFILGNEYYKIESFIPTVEKTIEEHAVAEEDYPDYNDVVDSALISQCEEITDLALQAVNFCAQAFALTLAFGETMVRAGNFSKLIIQADSVKELERQITHRQNLIAALPGHLGLQPNKQVIVLLISTDRRAFGWSDTISTRVMSLSMFDENENRISNIQQDIDYYLPVETEVNVTWETASLTGLKQWDLKVHRVDIGRDSNLLVEFGEVSGEIQVVILKGRRPSLHDFKNARMVSGNQTISSPTTKEDTFYYVAILPTSKSKKRLSEAGLTYNYRFMTQKCSDWHEGEWQAGKCRIGEKTSVEKIHCQCNLVSALSGYINSVNSKIDDVLPISFQLTLEVQYVIYATTLAVFAIYCVLLCFTVFRIKSGKHNIYFLGDNLLEGRYGYFVVVKTGNCASTSTTSNVTIKLYGTQSESKPHVLNYPDPNKKILQQNNTDCFLLSTTQHLGEILHAELWFDSIGQRPSWYCESIRIYDLQSESSWFFLAQTWFCLLRGIHYVILKPNKENNVLKKSSIFQSFRIYFGREHNWNLINSLDDRKFHYTERLSVVLSHILCTYSLVLLSCLTPGMRLADGFNPPFFQSYYSILGVSVGISLVSFLINIPFVFVFRHSARKHEGSVEFTPKLFPPVAVRYAWGILIALIITNLIYLILFGFWISYKASLIWLIITTVAIILEIFVVENIYVSLYLLWKKFYFKKRLNVIGYDFTAIIAESERQRRALFNKTSRFALRPYLVHLYSPLTREKFLEKRKKLLVRMAIAGSFRDMIALITYILILFFLLLAQLDYMSPIYNEHMHNMIAKAQFGGTKTLAKVHTIKDIYDYINETLIPTLHSTNWYGEWFATDPGLMSDFNTKVLGVARIRQQRVKQGACGTTDFMLKINVTECNPELTWGAMDTESDGTEGSIWYYTSRESGFMVAFGDMKTYFGGGYISLLGRTLNNAYYKLQFLKENNWIDARTRGLFIEFWTYNANLNLFNAVKLIFERSATQLILTKSQVFTAKLTSGDFGFELFTSVIVTFFMIIVAYQVIKCSVRIAKSPWAYFKNIWNIIDLFLILTSIAIICMFMIRSILVGNLLSVLETSKNNEFVNYFSVISFTETLKIIIATLICVAILRLWRFLRFILMFRIFERSLFTAAISLCVIFIYNLLFLFMFALSGYVAFGAISRDYRNTLVTFTNMILLSLNLNQHFDHEILANYNPIAAKVYYLAFMFTMLVLFSIYITVIILFYEESRNYYSNRTLGYSIKDYVLDEWHYFTQLTVRRLRQIRLHGGQEFPSVSYFKIYPKSDEKRYADCLQLPETQMQRMQKITRGVLYNLYLRRDKTDLSEKEIRLMQEVIVGVMSKKGDDSKKERFFVARTENDQAKFVSDERLLQMEVYLKRLLSLRQQDLVKDESSTAKIKNIETFASQLNVIVGNINVKQGKNKKV